MDKAIGDKYMDTVRVSSLGETIFRRFGPQEVMDKVKKPLTGLKVVCYFGCLLT